MLPAFDGDCFLLTYGTGDERRRILIDGGRASTYPLIRPTLAALAPEGLDLLVVTHVDQDHILGVLALFGDADRVPVGEVWFNGYDQLVDIGPDVESFGAIDGELLTTALTDQQVTWNTAFCGRAIEIGRPQEPRTDGARFDIVAPNRKALNSLAPIWAPLCRKEGLIPGVDPTPEPPDGFEGFGDLTVAEQAAIRFVADTSKTNATSIAFLFEFEGTRILFTGDGDDRILVQSLKPLAEREGGRLRIDAMKVAHHGSAGNISRALLDLVDCPRYLFSANGDRHNHPDAVAVSRILTYGGSKKGLFFNYRSRAQPWTDPQLRAAHGYDVTIPPAAEDGFLTLRWP